MNRKLALLMLLCTFPSSFANEWRSASHSLRLDDQEYIAKARAYFEEHMAKLTCDLTVTDHPRWNGFSVRRCSYTDVGVTTQVFMLDLSADQLARWTVTACKDAQAASMNKCLDKMFSWIQNASSGGLFPVSGYIVEPASSTGGTGNEATCILFRDGVTIATETWKTRKAIDGKCGPMDENDKPAKRAFKYARVASTRRQEYYNAGGTEPAGTEANFDVRWLDVVRNAYQKAWTSDRNQLISATAKALKASGSFN